MKKKLLKLHLKGKLKIEMKCDKITQRIKDNIKRLNLVKGTM